MVVPLVEEGEGMVGEGVHFLLHGTLQFQVGGVRGMGGMGGGGGISRDRL